MYLSIISIYYVTVTCVVTVLILVYLVIPGAHNDIDQKVEK